MNTATAETLLADKLLENQNVIVIGKVVEIFSELDNLGILDLAQGVLKDEETMGKIISSVTNDEFLFFLLRARNTLPLIAQIIDEEKINQMKYTLDVIQKLRDSPLTDLFLNMANDEDFLGKIVSALINDKTFQIVSNWNELLEVVVSVSENRKSITPLLDVLNSLNSSGILDLLSGILKDNETVGKVISGLVNDFTLGILTNWNDMVRHLSSLDITGFKGYVDIINAAGKAINNVDYKPVGSIFDILRLLRDPDIQNGLGFLFSIVRELGKMASKKNMKIGNP
ncbi:hypothetical protein HS7_11770 [Sulfolobales archaeon HS-7]|nr:hypothetical protein HS7_11770 [Sulfolobales archaeon HS-7]